MNQTFKAVDQPTRLSASILPRAIPITDVIADGLDALVDGRGWNSTHEVARLLANAAPELLQAAQDAVQWFNGDVGPGREDQVRQRLLRALENAKVVV